MSSCRDCGGSGKVTQYHSYSHRSSHPEDSDTYEQNCSRYDGTGKKSVIGFAQSVVKL
jgi:hypothetical protein